MKWAADRISVHRLIGVLDTPREQQRERRQRRQSEQVAS